MSVLIFNNGYLTKAPSGGDKHLLALLPFWGQDSPATIVLPSYAAPLVSRLPREDGEIEAAVTVLSYPSKPPRNLWQMVSRYLARTLRSVRIASSTEAELVFASPGLFDLLPGLWHRRCHSSRLGVFLFHVPGSTKGGATATNQTSSSPLRRWIANLAHRLSLRCLASADTIFVGNTLVQKQLEEQGFAPHRLVVHPPAVDPEAILRAEVETAPQVLFIGRLVASKGVLDLLEIAQMMDATFGIIGQGELLEELKARIEEKKLTNRVHLFGELPEKRLYGLLRGCQCLVLPSYEEGYALVIAEALIAGKIPVAYELPHYSEIFGDALVTVPPGDIPRMAEALTTALAAVPGQSGASLWEESRRAPTPHQAAEASIAALRARPAGQEKAP